jgi:hypothetical protein
MQDVMLMKKFQASQSHNHVRLNVSRCKYNVGVANNDFQICVHEVENERYVGFVPKDIEQADNIRVMKFLEQFYLAQSGSVYTVRKFGPRTSFDLRGKRVLFKMALLLCLCHDSPS